jgi:N-acetylmuramoyl-L-alanine amidase
MVREDSMYKIRSHKLAVGQAGVDFVASPNTGGALDPKFLVIHFTASGPSSDIAKYFSNRQAKVSAHVVVRRDGTVIQCVPFNVVAWHAGQSSWTAKDGQRYTGLNRSAIGIEIENWGPLSKSGSGWVSWTGSAVDASKVVEARHKNGGPVRGWETYTDAQIHATIDVAQAVCSHYDLTEIIGHDDISPGRKTDPGPAWDMSMFKAKVFGREEEGPEVFVVRSPTGLNIRSEPRASAPPLRPVPLADGTRVMIHEREGNWRFVSVLNEAGLPDFSGWVHGSYLTEV